jgi:phosphoribosylformimino-5-aminoimidazole carboxamide ribotide isomerase
LGDLGGWQGSDALSIARQAVNLGVSRLLVLDLARVGVAGGPGAADLCRRLAADYPRAEISAGGGVRDRADLERLRGDGVQAVLVASALHDGRLQREDLSGL